MGVKEKMTTDTEGSIEWLNKRCIDKCNQIIDDLKSYSLIEKYLILNNLLISLKDLAREDGIEFEDLTIAKRKE